MQQERWQKIDTIFKQAAELSSEERVGFVVNRCGNDEDLCREIMALVEADSDDRHFLDEPVYTAGIRLLEREELLTIGSVFSFYKIEKLIGEGGMGSVYLALDERLGRRAALKILPFSLNDDPEAVRRFRQEARTASQISHPNVAHIYEFGEHDGRYFLAMEFVEGKTLREIINAQKLTLSLVLDITRQIIEALIATHQRGIIHRDIKPENVILTGDGLVKVLDFGISKPLDFQPAETFQLTPNVSLVKTTPGLVLGTIGYISPEQLQNKPVDFKADIWSVGVCLYEMLTGKKPFSGKTAEEIAGSIVQQPTPKIVLPNLSREYQQNLNEILARALRKNAADRYPSAVAFAGKIKELSENLAGRISPTSYLAPDLEYSSGAVTNRSFGKNNYLHLTREFWRQQSLPRKTLLWALFFGLLTFGIGLTASFFQTTPKPPLQTIETDRISSLAVLPFQNETGQPQLDLLKEALAEDLARHLGSTGSAAVIAYSSSKRISDQSDTAQINKLLKVETIIRGRFLNTAEGISINVEMVDTGDGKVRWSNTFSGASDDLLKLRNALVGAIISEFQKLNDDRRLILTDLGTRNNEAYQAYLEGKYSADRINAAGTQRGVRALEKAVKLDPQYALAYTALADAYNLLGTWFGIKPDYYQPLAEKTIEKALALDGNLAEAHTSLAKIRMDFHHDWIGTEREFIKAIELNPNYAQAHHWYGEVFLSAMGRFDESIKELETARRLNPLSSSIVTGLAHSYMGKKEYERVVQLCDEAGRLNPQDDSVYSYKAMALMKLGRLEEAIETIKKIPDGDQKAEIAVYYALSGKTEESRRILGRIKNDPNASPYSSAIIHLALDEKDRAFELFEKQLATKSVDLLSIRVDPFLDPVRDDPRYSELEKKLKLPDL